MQAVCLGCQECFESAAGVAVGGARVGAKPGLVPFPATAVAETDEKNVVGSQGHGKDH